MIYYLNPLQYLKTDSEEIKQPDFMDAYAKLVTELNDWNTITVDTETTGLDFHKEKVLFIQIGVGPDQYVIHSSTLKKFPPYKRLLKNVFESTDWTKILHNAKFDYKMLLSNFGIRLNKVWDTYLVEKVLTNGKYSEEYEKLNHPYRYDSVIKKYCGIKDISKAIRLNFLNKKLESNNYTSKEIIYCAKDVEFGTQIMDEQKSRCEKLKLLNVAMLENMVTLAYAEMEYAGIKLDVDYWESTVIPFVENERRVVLDNLDNIAEKIVEEKNLDKYLLRAEAKNLLTDLTTEHVTYKNAPKKNKFRKLNIDWDSKQMTYQFFSTDLGYKCTYKNPKDMKRDTIEGINAVVIEDYADKNVIKHINHDYNWEEAKKHANTIWDWFFLYRHIDKLYSTYGTKMLSYVNNATGRIHPNYFQLGAETGRASCKRPNFQQQSGLRLIRDGFKVADPNGWLITADYAGMELRIAAGRADEPNWIKPLLTKEGDLHSSLASKAFGVEVNKKKNKHLRTQQKIINFGSIYMAHWKKFVPMFNSEKECKEFYDKVRQGAPRLFEFLEKAAMYGKLYGKSNTASPFTRTRWFPEWEKLKNIEANPEKYPVNEIKSAKKQMGRIERGAANHGIQGTGADIMKLATWEIYKWLISGPTVKNKQLLLNYNIKLVGQVHDEIIIEITGELDSIKTNIANIVVSKMEEAGRKVIQNVPMFVDYDIAKIWQK